MPERPEVSQAKLPRRQEEEAEQEDEVHAQVQQGLLYQVEQVDDMLENMQDHEDQVIKLIKLFLSPFVDQFN